MTGLLLMLVLAHADEVVLNTSTDLRDWCQRETEAQLIGQQLTPSNWTARHYEKGNTLVVEGHWRIDGESVDVECRVARGAQARFASAKLMPR